MAEDLAASLSARGWATCDFITSDAVAICREEIKHVAPHYTPGEIWLGKRASGAQISVKSVRGDRVFWMHPEQIELGGFVALAEMLAAIDRAEPQVMRTMTNMRLASSQAVLLAEEIRAAPWRAFAEPSEKAQRRRDPTRKRVLLEPQLHQTAELPERGGDGAHQPVPAEVQDNQSVEHAQRFREAARKRVLVEP